MQLGLRANWQQFTLLVIVNGFVGAMVGLERTVVPLIAEKEFGIVSGSLILSFLFSFGIVKAFSNFFAGSLSDKVGRKKILVIGWLIGLPVPLIIIFAPSWGWIVFANVLLGINQGLCWSATVIMKIDLVGPKQRGLAMGINEFAGYVCVSAAALLTGYLAASYRLRPVPFYPGIIFATAGLIISALFVKDTAGHVQLESELHARIPPGGTPLKSLFLSSLWKNKNLLSANQAGLVNNLNDAVIWGLAPVLLLSKNLSLRQIALVSAVYPAAWGFLQLITGLLSDKWGRKWLIVLGMWLQAVSLVVFVLSNEFSMWLLSAAFLGLGTAMVYPTLIAAVSDVSAPGWRASAVGIYRFWRDSGYAVGAVLAGIFSDAFNMQTAILIVGVITFFSGTFAAAFMKETLNPDLSFPRKRESI